MYLLYHILTLVSTCSSFAGGFAPGTPALNRLRRLQSQQNRHSGGRRIPETALTVSAHPVGFFPGSRHEPRLLQSFIQEKFWGVWGTLSRVPRRIFAPCIPGGAEAGYYKQIEESSGGSGGLFQESPGASLPLASPGAEAGCYNKFEESSGGFGGLFQEPPGASPPAGCPECGEITGFFQTRGSRRAG